MAALGNSRTLLPVEYPLSSLTSWSDAAAAAAAVGYNYPCAAGPAVAAHQFVYGGGRLAGAPHPAYNSACPAVGTLGAVADSSCSMYSSWRHRPTASPLSSFYRHQPDADWILRQSKLESASHPFSHRHHHQQQQQRWKVTSDSASVAPLRDVTTTSITTSNLPGGSGGGGPLCGLRFATAGAAVDNTSHDGSSGSCAAGLSPVMDAWTTTGRSSVTTVDQFICRTQALQDTHAALPHTGNSNEITQSNLGTGPVATPGGRSTDSVSQWEIQ